MCKFILFLNSWINFPSGYGDFIWRGRQGWLMSAINSLVDCRDLHWKIGGLSCGKINTIEIGKIMIQTKKRSKFYDKIYNLNSESSLFQNTNLMPLLEECSFAILLFSLPLSMWLMQWCGLFEFQFVPMIRFQITILTRKEALQLQVDWNILLLKESIYCSKILFNC